MDDVEVVVTDQCMFGLATWARGKREGRCKIKDEVKGKCRVCKLVDEIWRNWASTRRSSRTMSGYLQGNHQAIEDMTHGSEVDHEARDTSARK